jgi:Ran GTPase-activating protein (RanGAP) involved in mRNA processing and transport
MKSKKIIQSILSENAIDAKKLIQQDLTIKLGERLAEEYVRVAKKTFNEQYEEEEEEGLESEDEEDEDEEDEEEEPMTESSKSKLAAMYPPEDKITRGDIIAAAQKNKKKKK